MNDHPIVRIAQDLVDSHIIDKNFDADAIELDPKHQDTMLTVGGDDVSQCGRCGRVVDFAEMESNGGAACDNCMMEADA